MRSTCSARIPRVFRPKKNVSRDFSAFHTQKRALRSHCFFLENTGFEGPLRPWRRIRVLGGGGSPPDSRADTPMADRCPSFVRVDTNTARSNTGPPRRPLRSRIRLHGKTLQVEGDERVHQGDHR